MELKALPVALHTGIRSLVVKNIVCINLKGALI
jgi:hypothetical protein